MSELSATQSFMLCALTQQGKWPSTGGIKRSACLVAGGLLELLLDGTLMLDDKKQLYVQRRPAKDKSYLTPLMEYVEQAKPQPINVLVERIASARTAEFGPLLRSVGFSLSAHSAVSVRENPKKPLEMPLFIPQRAVLDTVVAWIRDASWCRCVITDDVQVLMVLLHKSGILFNYFSKYESEECKKRLLDVVNKNPNVRLILSYLEAMGAFFYFDLDERPIDQTN